MPFKYHPEELAAAHGLTIDYIRKKNFRKEDKVKAVTYLRPDHGKCLHYYFYFIDEEFGLWYLRVPTWCPFRLQFYCNGHNWLAPQLESHDLRYRVLDDPFTGIEDFAHHWSLDEAECATDIVFHLQAGLQARTRI